jgi:hypothetical protein
MSSSLVVALIVVVGSILSIGYALQASDSGGADGPSPGAGQTSLSSADLEQLREGMISGCTSAGTPASVCECVSDQIIASGSGSPTEMLNLTLGAEAVRQGGDTSNLPPAAATAFQQCFGPT